MNKKLPNRFLLGLMVLVIMIPGGTVYRQYRADMQGAYQRTASGGKVIETACGPVQYSEYGEGPPMLIVHGAGGGYDQGEYFAKIFGANYRWIAPSRFGFLGSPVPDGADTALQADAYACLLDALGIDQVGVVGMSMGGPSSLSFARQYPERTRSLAVISAASHAIPPRPGPIAAIFNVFLNDFVFWSMVRLSPEGMLVVLGIPTEVQKQLSSAETAQLHGFLESILPMGARRNGQMLEQHMSEYDAELIRQIQAPTLVLHARDDSLVAFDQAEFTAQNVPGAELISMEKGGHLALMFDMNAGARERLLGFLEQHNRR